MNRLTAQSAPPGEDQDVGSHPVCPALQPGMRDGAAACLGVANNTGSWYRCGRRECAVLATAQCLSDL